MANEETQGFGLFIAGYVDERGADKARDAIQQARKRGELAYGDAAVVRHSAEGKVYVNESGDVGGGKGAGFGAVVGGVIGLLGGPAGVVLGAGAGAAIGGVTAKFHDSGFNDANLKEIGGALPSGTSALVATTDQRVIEEIRKQSPSEDRLTLAREIAAEISAHLEARQDVLLAMAVTEDGVAAGKVVSSPAELAAFGIVATEEGVAARAAVATAEGAAVADIVATPEEADATATEPEAPTQD